MQYPNFDNVEVNHEWAFESVRSTEQWTHGYHRYPAKFLPNVVKKIIEDYAPDCEVVADLFAGCGTTLVEAKAHGKMSIGTDINPVAHLITKVKTTPIEPAVLQQAYDSLVVLFDKYVENDYINIDKHERIDYWFFPSEKAKIAFLFSVVKNAALDDVIKDFFYVCISHILKNCSRWLQSSTKPQIDPNKKILDPFEDFKRHCQKMIKSNRAFYDELAEKGNLGVQCDIRLEDARHTSIADGSVDIIITSPPYVTSYEYADIHQLTGYWMDYIQSLLDFRKSFIGTSFSGNTSLEVYGSDLGQTIVNELAKKSKHIAHGVTKYFNDMQEVSKEMVRILAQDGQACIVIGNTKIKDVHIKSAEVFYDYLQKAGMHEVAVVKRNIPHKLMPTLRDNVTGKFTTLDNPNCKKVYPNEYVIIMGK